MSAASLFVFQQYCARIIAELTAVDKRSLLQREISFEGEETIFVGDHEKVGPHDPKSSSFAQGKLAEGGRPYFLFPYYSSRVTRIHSSI
jgi:hypothetical protein